MFCPFCGCLLFAQVGGTRVVFTCRICPVNFPVKNKISTRTYYKAKAVDHVFGGEDAYKNCDKTTETCPKCGHLIAYFTQMQTRSADEPMTNFFHCANSSCGHNWRD